MDIYQILVTYNRPWSTNEKIAFGGLLCAIAAVLIVCFYQKKLKKAQAISIFLLAIFLSIVFESTIFTRTVSTHQYELVPFWSWRAIYLYHDWELLKEDLLNCILLMPVGILLPFILNHQVEWKKALSVGLIISFTIECSQLIFMRGLFEWDDIIHNSFGCMIACLCSNRIFYKKS